MGGGAGRGRADGDKGCVGEGRDKGWGEGGDKSCGAAEISLYVGALSSQYKPYFRQFFRVKRDRHEIDLTSGA